MIIADFVVSLYVLHLLG